MTAGYGLRCLMARRLIEAGVRFVQIYPGKGQPWDHHSNIKKNMPEICAKTDQPITALLKDLKSGGLLESTILMWAGEFGRPSDHPNSDGRDHNRNAFSLWLAGGGFKEGLAYGETDEFGYKSTVNRVGLADLQATLLHQLGLDHKRLTFLHEDGKKRQPMSASQEHALLPASSEPTKEI